MGKNADFCSIVFSSHESPTEQTSRLFETVYHPVTEAVPPLLYPGGELIAAFCRLLGVVRKWRFLFNTNISTGRFKNGWKT
jgi:hypothetical protein